MAYFLPILAFHAAQSNTLATADRISLASLIVAIVFGLGGTITAIVALVMASRSNKHNRELAKRIDASEEPRATLEGADFNAQALQHTCIAKLTVSNRSRLPDAIMSADITVEGVDVRTFMEKQIFICNLPGDTFRPEFSNQKNWPHVYPVKLDAMSSATFMVWFHAGDLGAHRMYPPEDHPVELKIVLKTMRGQTLEKKFVYARSAKENRQAA
jgi:hypothetical protein